MNSGDKLPYGGELARECESDGTLQADSERSRLSRHGGLGLGVVTAAPGLKAETAALLDCILRASRCAFLFRPAVILVFAEVGHWVSG